MDQRYLPQPPPILHYHVVVHLHVPHGQLHPGMGPQLHPYLPVAAAHPAHRDGVSFPVNSIMWPPNASLTHPTRLHRRRKRDRPPAAAAASSADAASSTEPPISGEGAEMEWTLNPEVAAMFARTEARREARRRQQQMEAEAFQHAQTSVHTVDHHRPQPSLPLGASAASILSLQQRLNAVFDNVASGAALWPKEPLFCT